MCHRYGTVGPCWALASVCYRGDRVYCRSSPNKGPVGGCYARYASVLCGDWICGGSLDFPATDNAGSRSGHPFSVIGSSVEITHRFGRAPRCASISSARAHFHPVQRSSTKVSLSHLFLASVSHYNLLGKRLACNRLSQGVGEQCEKLAEPGLDW